MVPAMSAVRQVVGPAIAEWDEMEPLRWTLSETISEGTRAERKVCSFDLTTLLQGYSVGFLLALKALWIDSRLKVRLTTLNTEAYRIRAILQTCQDEFAKSASELSSASPVFDQIGPDFLVGLWAVKDSVPKMYLTTFRSFFRNHRHNGALFERGLHDGDFPTSKDTDDANAFGPVAQLRKSVMGSALPRAALVHILNITEAAYESGDMSLGVFAFSRLLLSRAARPESFRVLRLKDLRIDEDEGTKTYYLTLTIPKARTAKRPMATIRLHPDVGRILDQQRAAVADRFGHLVVAKNVQRDPNDLHSPSYTIGDLPLFPAGGSSGRTFQDTKERLGMIANASDLYGYYMRPLKTLTQVKLNHIALRHTMGTQLAIAGCSTSTIAAVLLHATHRAAAVYVDLVFSGTITELSDSLEPAFVEHFPVIREFASIRDAIDPAKRIVSPTVDRSRRETTGECGRRQICHYAPITCYECHRFKPCYDADHTVNLRRVEEEIASARDGGLPREIDVKRYIHIANRIRAVISICEAKRDAVESGNAAPKVAL